VIMTVAAMKGTRDFEGRIGVAIQVCYICTHNHPNNPDDQAVSYSDCVRCERPTCKKHGRTIDGDDFHCIRCLREIGR